VNNYEIKFLGKDGAESLASVPADSEDEARGKLFVYAQVAKILDVKLVGTV
jgi:hypothetical protein